MKKVKDTKYSEYITSYIKNNYDELKIRLPKGKRETIKTYLAQNHSKLSINQYIIDLIKKDMGKYYITEDDSINKK